MGFQVDLKEFLEVLAKLQKDTGKTNEQLEKAKNALNGIIQADAMQGETGKAIVNDINNNQKTVVTGLELANKFLIMEMAQTLQDFQSTTGETDENAVILEDALLQAQNKLSNLQPKKHEMDSRISNIYNSVSDLISLSMPNSQFDEKLVAASKELEDTIQKVQQFESKKEKSNAEDILNTLNKQVQMAKEMSSLSYTDPQLQAFFAQDALAKGIHEMDTQITKAEKEAKLQAEREMKKKQEEWADNHPVEAWLQNFSKSAGEKWDVLRKGTKWVGENIPFLKGLSDDLLVLEGFIGAAGSAVSGIAIGATKVVHLAWELGEWGYNSMRGVETEQWKLDDIYGAGNTIKSLGQAIISWQDYPKYGKALVNSIKGYVEKALTDPYALGGAIFDIGSCFIGVGEVTAAVKGTAALGKFAEGTKVFQVAAKSDKIVGKLEEITALMNKLPKNALEKIKNIEIPNLFPEPALAGGGRVGERKTLGELFSVAKSETKGTGNTVHRSEIDEVIKNNYDKDGNLINRSIVPKGYDSVEDFLKQVDDTTIKEFGYDSVEEFKEVVELTETYLNTKTKNNILNKPLAGGTHVKKGVDFDILGFPIFKGDDVKFTMKLKSASFKMPDRAQFKECTAELKGKIESGEISKELFTPEQLSDIMKGKAKIKDLTWHHHQIPGKMQLVNSDVHGVNHLGGNKLWGDGIR
ncbi:T7SS effector LXG polymorphic toxin [Bacillus mycoides]|uniref:T7SS effector LXG polymorphic toxin n=2 Tax=Bacillus cereus group TaxID=86661 RepID=UPI003D1A12A6